MATLSESPSLPQPRARQIEYAVRQLGGILPGLAKAPLGFAMVATALGLSVLGRLLARSPENPLWSGLMLGGYLLFILAFIAAAKLKIWYVRRFGSIAPTVGAPWTPREMKFAAIGWISIVLSFLIAAAVLQPALQASLLRLSWALGTSATRLKDWRTAPHGMILALALLASCFYTSPSGVSEHLITIGLFGLGQVAMGLCDHALLVRFLPEPREE